ncbi:MAG: hypothetical protein ABSB49_19445 [Polyangia bacterium]
MNTICDFVVRRRLAILLVVAALPRLWLAWFEHGTNHPDEIFQVLEPAHRFVYGFGIQTWEFRDGARSWFLPGIVALLWKCLAMLGLSDPLTVVPLLRMPFVALAVYAVYLAYRLAMRMVEDERAGDLAALLAASAPLALLLDFRSTTEAASAPLVLLALLALLDGRTARAGAWLALLVFLRPTNAILGLATMAWLLLTGKFRDSVRLVLGALPVTLAGGLLDWITWGSPFHHLVEYVRFNWTESGERFGVEGPWSYGRTLLVTAPLIAVLLLPATAGLLRKWREARLPLVTGWLFLIFHSAIGHKEPRFLLPVVPLLAALSGAGVFVWVSSWLDRLGIARCARVTAMAVGGAAVFLCGLFYTIRLTYKDLQPLRHESHGRVLFGESNAVNRLLVEAGKQPNLCGLLLLGVVRNEIYSGGTTYLNRNVLLASNPASEKAWVYLLAATNYIIAPASVRPSEWQPIAQRDNAVLSSRQGECVALPETARPHYPR